MWKIGGGGGSRFGFPLRTAFKAPGNVQEASGLAWFQNLPGCFWRYEDFLWDAYDDTEHWLSLYDASAAGTPTKDLVADGTGGQFQLQASTTNEAQLFGFAQGDNLYIQGNKPFLFETRLKTVHTMAANQILVWGLASDINTSTLDNITRNVWFREETDTDLMVELDDNTTDTDDFDTGVDVTAGTFYIYQIEFDGNQVYFRRSDATGQYTKTLKKISPAFGANNLQPVILVQKTTGTTQPEIIVDYVAYVGVRA